MNARASDFDERAPSAAEIENANEIRRVLAHRIRDSEPTRLQIVLDDRRGELVLMPSLARSLMELLRHVGSGRAVTMVPTDEMLTTQRAADILNVSRPHLIKLLENGELPYTKVGRHRRVRAEHVLAYKRRRDAERTGALSELAEADADLI